MTAAEPNRGKCGTSFAQCLAIQTRLRLNPLENGENCCPNMQEDTGTTQSFQCCPSNTPPTARPTLIPSLPCKFAQTPSAFTATQDVPSSVHVCSEELAQTGSWQLPPQQPKPSRFVLPMQKLAQLLLLHFSSHNKQLTGLRPPFPARTRFFSCETTRSILGNPSIWNFLITLLIHSCAAEVPDWPRSAFSPCAVRYSSLHKTVPLLK